MYYVIDVENGTFCQGCFDNFCEAYSYAESYANGYDFTISEYESQEDFENNL